MEPNLEIVGGGTTYDALVGLITVGSQRTVNYGSASILINAALQPQNMRQMIEVFGGDNFDCEVQQLVTLTLLPELAEAIKASVDGPTIVVYSKNCITHMEGLGPYQTASN